MNFKSSIKHSIVFRFFFTILSLMVSVQAIGLAFLLVAPPAALASALEMNLEVPIPTLTGGETKINIKFNGTTQPIINYIISIYNYAVGVVGILAAVVMMIGGLMWITAGGNTSTIGEAKTMITASLTGLVLVLTSYLILSNINPALVNLRSSVIPSISVPTATTTAPCNNCSVIKDSGFNISSTACCHDKSKCEIKPCQADKKLLNALNSFKDQFTVTGAWPPTPGAHTAGRCHDVGTCIDIVPTTGGYSALQNLATKLKNSRYSASNPNGVQYIQYEADDCSALVKGYLEGIPCVVNPQSSGAHFHVQLYSAGTVPTAYLPQNLSGAKLSACLP